jgi:hypothetical protein
MVGGDPSVISASGAALRQAATAVGSTATGIAGAGARAESAAGDPRIAAALSRFVRVTGRQSTDLGLQLAAAGLLATNSATDLTTADGGPAR